MEEKHGSVCVPAWTAGVNAYQGLPQIAEKFGKRIFLIGGLKALQAGQQKLIEGIMGSNMEIVSTHSFTGICSMAQAQALADEAVLNSSDMVFGMGGGKAIDCAKAAAHLAGLAVFTFPTIAATCAAVTKLCVMYKGDGSFDSFLFLREPPKHAFIDMDIIAHSPAKYLRAGIGDSLAKHVESSFSARGAEQSYEDILGLSIAQGLADVMLKEGEQAMEDNKKFLSSPALLKIALQNIVSVGLVSLFVREEFNSALAHSLYYALEALPQMKHCLHGDVVAWGSLVQLVMDHQPERAQEFMHLLRAIGTPCSLEEMGVSFHDPEVQSAIRSAVDQPDMRFLPYEVSPQNILDAVNQVEEMAEVEAANVH